MKRKNLLLLFVISIVLLAVSCGPGKKKSEGGGEKVDTSKFPAAVKNDGKAVEGATLKVAIVKDSPLVGIFTSLYSNDAYDAVISDIFTSEQIFDTDENFEVTDTGAATLTVDIPNKKAIIKIKDNVKWSDGQPMVAEDVIYAYEVIGSKDYEGIRYDDENEKIIGMKEYHAGKADTISGIKKIDDKTVEITFTEIGQNIYTLGNGLIGQALPKHYLGDVPIKELVSSEKIRDKIIAIGPYYPVKSVQGESIELKANPHYFKGKAKIDRVTIQIVNSQTAVAALKAGEYDIAYLIPGNLYNTFKDLNNLEVLGRQELYYSYMGFKVGRFDKEKGENIVDPNAKMSDVRLRKALAYGLNVDKMLTFYHGLRERATSSVPPVFKKYFPEGLEGYPYNPEKAKQLLDEAGYKDVDGDGYREDKNGKPFEVRIAAMAGGDIAEPLSQFYIQNWKEIGIKAVLTTGRLIEFNNFYQKVDADDKDIDIYFAAWGVGTNLNPIEFSGRKSPFNRPRFASEENDRLMNEIVGEKSLSVEGYKAEAYKKWQEYYMDQAVEVPLTYRYELVPVNKRVKNFNVSYDRDKNSIHRVELTEKEPLKASK
ncbi:oligopeptide ABC transporter substrate-binding protein [Leptotrichia sp. OH3620_COT-345]|uniref:oligopeptide ABC transporter substrate-binding protein n=1 Tax=Leptotrichia sp. OH3620_COT-345 TaxID=2491048 RepID=UPI000F64F0A3|nr:oligopeptide ABC transporter substrate-binding protein [Leptotrichia sp. OH3620_COT-345]RRD41027.1 oligopeptide ABC transporter substrate-binding protein [Leptotrichia sp. OH3620_COT-345]